MGLEVRGPRDEEMLKVYPVRMVTCLYGGFPPPLPSVNSLKFSQQTSKLAWHPRPSGGSSGDFLWESFLDTPQWMGWGLSCVSS